jgi:preprotein translocase subunit SecF
MFIIKHKEIFIGISAALAVAALVLLLSFGLKIGIDFKGGALMEIAYKTERPDQEELNKILNGLNLGSILLQPTGELGYLIKSQDLKAEEHTLILETLSKGDKKDFEEISFNSIGPSVGKEITKKSIIATILLFLSIISFITLAFRKVSKPVSSWKYGLVAVITLLHDVIIPIGLFVLLSKYYGAEVDTLFVVAILTTIGLSVSDTIVIFDRIREHLKNCSNVAKADFNEIVGQSLDRSFIRSINTSLTVILVLLALFFFGPVSVKYFTLMLATGLFVGTYSSIFLASPLLVVIKNWQDRRENFKN